MDNSTKSVLVGIGSLIDLSPKARGDGAVEVVVTHSAKRSSRDSRGTVMVRKLKRGDFRPAEIDAQRLAGDWHNVGRSIKVAIETYGSGRKPSALKARS